ncbi:MAG TPA: sigma-70 family RNA polymerase sigma factor [Bacilli bacterium]|nr:sigma-70 family RNA polymerase sigma factor [Bacilli bacterium]
MKYEEYNDYELMYLVSENDEEASSTIYKKYQPIIYKYATKYFSYGYQKGLEYQDMVQEGRIGLSKAIEGFNGDRSMFYTFANICIEKQILKSLKKASSKKNDVLNNATLGDEGFNEEMIYNAVSNKKNSSVETVEDSLFEREIIMFKHSLDLSKSYIFELRYNFFSYKDIAAILEISEKQVDNALLSIRKLLKNYLKALK